MHITCHLKVPDQKVFKSMSHLHMPGMDLPWNKAMPLYEDRASGGTCWLSFLKTDFLKCWYISRKRFYLDEAIFLVVR